MHGHAEKPEQKIGWFRRWRVNRLLDMPEKEAAGRLAKLRFPPLPYLISVLEAGGAKSSKAAYLIGKLAESGVDCGEALQPLYGLLQDGTDMEKGMAAVALARMWSAESVSMLMAGMSDKNNTTRLYSALGLGMAQERNQPVCNVLRKAAQSDWDPRVRDQAQRSLGQIAERLG